MVGILFAASIGFVMPLLKVMMNEEGLHGWIERTVARDRYGVDFYLPDREDLSDPDNRDMPYKLRITNVSSDSVAEAAGLRTGDMIVGVGSYLLDEQTERIGSSLLLQELAQVEAQDKSELTVQYRRVDGDQLVLLESQLEVTAKPFYADAAERLLGYVPRDQGPAGSQKAMQMILVLFVIFTAIRCLARYFQDYTVHKVVHTAGAHLREDMFSRSLAAPTGFFVSEGGSDTVSRLVSDSQQAVAGVNVLFGKALREPLKALSVVGLAMWIDWQLTLLFIAGGPAAIIVVANLGKKIKKATRKTLEASAKMLGKLAEVINSIKVVKVYNRQDDEGKVFSGINRTWLRQQLKVAKVDSMTEPILEVIAMIVGSIGLMWALGRVFEGHIQPSEFFTLLLALGVSAESLRKTSTIWNKIQRANAAAQRAFTVIDREPEYEDPQARQIEPLRDIICFENVVFTYPGSAKPVLRGINLSVKAGQNIAIVGPNGSGKTTLANLVPRFYDPDSGRILIDGQDIKKATLKSLRAQMALVTQQVTTFHATIAENIAYGKPEATRDEIIEAAKMAYAHEFIEPLSEGYDTFIGEQGAGLSGGQLQRIIIARAILKNPAILIFDEATSQVDADSESKIHKAIEQIMHHRTSFIIAHRFSTIISADLIVVMNYGKIVAKGTHGQLLESCKLYQSLYETQVVKS